MSEVVPVGARRRSAMRLYDTARRAVVPFEPDERVTMYVCGITPYDATHLGHAATYVTYDVLQRRLEDRGHEVRLVRNITDVDDDLLRAARARGVHYLDLGNGELARFHDDLAALNVRTPWSEPRATGAIPDIRGLIAMVIARGLAYQSGGGVYFDVSRRVDFGALSGLSRDEMRVIGADRGEHPDDPNKRHPLDFVLWQPSQPGEPWWESPWGRGRPGWHVECSALALRELGPTIDLHGGGTDLVYPHHECERVQSESASGEPFVRHWLHQAMVLRGGQKMAKSTGNLVFVADLRAIAEPAAVRLVLLAQHYRCSWEWQPALLDRATERWARWRAAGDGEGDGDEVLDDVRAALDDDLDTPRALAIIDAAAGAGRGVSAAAALLGVDLEDSSRGA
jgi:L-cysteine:1D-myo-inositol 2-amino-2-deoxy-alpha-D-glucopyranoside ligase